MTSYLQMKNNALHLYLLYMFRTYSRIRDKQSYTMILHFLILNYILKLCFFLPSFLCYSRMIFIQNCFITWIKFVCFVHRMSVLWIPRPSNFWSCKIEQTLTKILLYNWQHMQRLLLGFIPHLRFPIYTK